ncbi:hypothetical protein BU23DRAFT_543911 [Bimuria novae-zelandiae CBS 107.79]|uniref:Uncharacterized protein n=1 Tax=Bimuria novae-zelandiae CBS 107.79 TaxID=1447943 RepID=A0A6A5UV80_9PLEO|nr:hypothetical protein BU23DRAFT_543911 [Bimuria novae-zelandiae CBS 107.79]
MDGHSIRNRAAEKLIPPIPKSKPMKASTSTHDAELSLPALAFQGHRFLRPNQDRRAYLALDLKTPRLNDIHQHLWLAGLPSAARPLHRQKLIGRSILITEDPDEHMVWFETHIFIKPLPDFLFDWDCWNDNLCSDHELHKSAYGLLLSYAWLVQHKSDLDIAKEASLLPEHLEWPDWVRFLEAFLDNVNLHTLSDVNKRYHYGELRLSRLNTIYRLAPPTYSVTNFIRGYRAGSTWYNAFFERHFKWMLAVFAILSVFLSALQVGLATPKLQENGSFQRASYGFTIASVVAVMAGVALVFIVWLGLFGYYLLSTWWNDRAVAYKRHRRETSGEAGLEGVTAHK